MATTFTSDASSGTTTHARRVAGQMLREWRTHRRLSQLDLAILAEVSQKHLSYVETGRSMPSPEMILHLCAQMEVPLRDRNAILLAAGYAPRYAHDDVDGAAANAARQMIDLVLSAHPYPAVVVDGHWDLVDLNAAAAVFLDGIPAELLRPPVNVVRLSLHPDGLAKRILNMDEYAAHIIERVQHIVARAPDPVLLDILVEYGDLGLRSAQPVDAAGDRVLPMVLDTELGPLRLFSTITTFGAPREVTLSELAIESFYPADTESAALLSTLTAQRTQV